jgi:hypothetical protein
LKLIIIILTLKPKLAFWKSLNHAVASDDDDDYEGGFVATITRHIRQ